MSRCLLMLLVLAFPAPSAVADGQSGHPNFAIEVAPDFPRALRFVVLKETLANLLSPCRREATSGGWDVELLKTIERRRRQLADVILAHIVDEEVIPAESRPVPIDHRARTVTIDPFAFGPAEFRTDAVPDGYRFEVALEGHVLLALLSRPGTRYSIAIWRWNSKDHDKSCGFAYQQ